jgi:hypothetical protein
LIDREGFAIANLIAVIDAISGIFLGLIISIGVVFLGIIIIDLVIGGLGLVIISCMVIMMTVMWVSLCWFGGHKSNYGS